mmetsp:Transcript_10525/g.20304  ORF Transcript_10525/g.20304 Transcript_10525/m.20304 type:complete len:724 (+) Transcript_10525:67-2238(+)
MGGSSGRRLSPVEDDGGTALPTQTVSNKPQAARVLDSGKGRGSPTNEGANLRSHHNPVAQQCDGIFGNLEQMKETVREQMCKPKYDVAIFYHTTGFTQWIARHPRFEQLTLLVIGLNALWIWIDTDHNPGSVLLNSPPIFQLVEYFFCIYFTFEWAMRFGAFERKCSGLRDRWFVFDSFLVGTMVFETWLMTSIVLMVGGGGSLGNAGILRMARLLRLTRMARMARLLRAMPELLILIKGMVAAMRSVGFTLGLLFVLLYIFGIAFVQLCDGSPCAAIFPDVPEAMHELLLNAALADGLSNLVGPLKKESFALLLVLYAFIFLSALTVMNMLIGVICEVVSAVAATERETLSLSFVREKIQELLIETGADEDNDHMLTKQEFVQLVTHRKAVPILQDVGVDVEGLIDVQDTLFEGDAEIEESDDDELNFVEEKKLSFTELMNVVLDLRGTNTATVRDIVNLRKYIHGRLTVIEQKMSRNLRRASSMDPTGSGSLRPYTAPAATCNDGLEERFAESMSKSQNVSPSLHGTLSNMRGLMSKHEAEVAALEADNRNLREQVAKLAQVACKWSLSESPALCKELGCTTGNAVAPAISPYDKSSIIQPPQESLSSLQTEASFLSSSCGFHHATPPGVIDCQEPAIVFSTVLRAAADGKEVGLDASTAGKVLDRGNGVAAANASARHGSADGRSITQMPLGRAATAPCNVFAASSAAMSVAYRSEEEPW